MDSDHTLPTYTPSTPSPSYSTILLPGERTVEQTQRQALSSYTGSFRRITDDITLVLKDQRPGSIVPAYGRNALLEGALTIEMSFYSSKTTLIASSFTMWQSDGSSSARPPLNIPFVLVFPTTYQDGGQEYPLPPTFDSEGSPASCSYTLTVALSKPRQLLPFLTQSETLSIPLHYYPRSRPHAPILPSGLSFMSTVKSSPEEWHQVMSTMNSVPSSGIVPIQCSLFIPSVQVFALTDVIPFHLQLRGPKSSLSAFIYHVSSPTGSNSSLGIIGTAIRVYISRQVIVKVGEEKIHRKRVLGEGTLRALSSSSDIKPIFRHSSSTDGLDTLDWEGELQCNKEITTPGFSIPQLAVKDSIVLSITPPQPLTSPLLRLHHEHVIRLATDPWSDQG
ncbi:hypothetical protein SERLA73DRAFT_153556 [Serpula lacrymans var. lacrymans S7.3]|uniref:Arrestin-like N-terminal domain-containing protein n=1 Tax=Serpula lacrymans var. lacrymans (strain S7.3) TaxID=936435 RepID=F8Q052_SERL3|nr:hypothetical protein SERLA73DRAFT_153556 [Serpula lacrymans var. lacrymans S7.3]